jgi:hypothetical protein
VHPGRRAKTGHGNDRVWKAWKAMMPAFHPSHTLWKSLWDFHISTASTTGYMSSYALKPNHRHRKGLVTDVSGPQRNACPGTLSPLARYCVRNARRLLGPGVAGQEQAPLWRVVEDAQRLQTGEERSFSLQENTSFKCLQAGDCERLR